MAKKIRVRKADIEWAKKVKERDHHTCRKCGTRYPSKARGLHAAHIFSRRYKNTRHDILNGLTLCTYDHIGWAHVNPLEFHEWAKQQLGEETYEALRLRAQEVKK